MLLYFCYNLVCFGTYQKRAQNQVLLGVPKTAFLELFETFRSIVCVAINFKMNFSFVVTDFCDSVVCVVN
jgi:hypothetical protein